MRGVALVCGAMRAISAPLRAREMCGGNRSRCWLSVEFARFGGSLVGRVSPSTYLTAAAVVKERRCACDLNSCYYTPAATVCKALFCLFAAARNALTYKELVGLGSHWIVSAEPVSRHRAVGGSARRAAAVLPVDGGD